MGLMEVAEVSSGSDSGLRSSAGTGSCSCFHGEAKRPPVDDATVRDCVETTR